MRDLDPSWLAYARLQLRSRRRSRVDAAGWGLEASLDHLLTIRPDDELCDRDHEAAEAAERGKARERHRTDLRLRYCDPLQISDPTTMLDDLARLRNLLSRLDKSERAIMLAVGLGHDSATIADCHSAKPAAIRQKIARLRERFA